MCTCYGTAIPYPIGPVYHTAIETNMEADVCMPGVESSRLLFFLTARNVISVTIAVHSPTREDHWRASETLLGVYKFELVRYVYIYIYIINIPPFRVE